MTPSRASIWRLAAAPPGAEKTLCRSLPPPLRRHSTVRDDQRDRVFCHGNDHRAAAPPRVPFRAEPFLFAEPCHVGGRLAPADLPRDIINSLEEGVLIAKVQRIAGKVDLLSLEITRRRGDRVCRLGRGRTAHGVGQPAQQVSFGRCGSPCRQLERCNPGIAPGDPAKSGDGCEDGVTVHGPFRSGGLGHRGHRTEKREFKRASRVRARPPFRGRPCQNR